MIIKTDCGIYNTEKTWKLEYTVVAEWNKPMYLTTWSKLYKTEQACKDALRCFSQDFKILNHKISKIDYSNVKIISKLINDKWIEV